MNREFFLRKIMELMDVSVCRYHCGEKKKESFKNEYGGGYFGFGNRMRKPPEFATF